MKYVNQMQELTERSMSPMVALADSTVESIEHRHWFLFLDPITFDWYLGS